MLNFLSYILKDIIIPNLCSISINNSVASHKEKIAKQNNQKNLILNVITDIESWKEKGVGNKNNPFSIKNLEKLCNLNILKETDQSTLFDALKTAKRCNGINRGIIEVGKNAGSLKNNADKLIKILKTYIK